jgi:outer membrane autotransporter protein
VASRLGGRLSTVWGAFTPEVSLAWQHEFGNTSQTINASFASAPAGADFSVISATTGRDGAAVVAGLSYALGPQNKISVQYDGFFTGSYYSNAVVGRWTAKW